MKTFAAIAETATITLALGSLFFCTWQGIALMVGLCAAVHMTTAICGVSAMFVESLR